MTNRRIHSGMFNFPTDLLPPVEAPSGDLIAGPAPEVTPGADPGYYLEIPFTQATGHLISMLGTNRVPLLAPWPLPLVTHDGKVISQAPWGYALDIERLSPEAYKGLLDGAVEAAEQLTARLHDQGHPHDHQDRETVERMLLDMAPRLPEDDLLRVAYTRPAGEPVEVHPRADAMLTAYLAATFPRSVPTDGVIDQTK